LSQEKISKQEAVRIQLKKQKQAKQKARQAAMEKVSKAVKGLARIKAKKKAEERARKKAFEKWKKKKKAEERAKKKAFEKWKKKKKAEERAKKKAFEKWRKKKRAMERTKKRKTWEELRRAEELKRARELSLLKRQNLKLKEQDRKLEDERLRLEREKLEEEREKREIEKRKMAIEEERQRAGELARAREVTRLEREKLEGEKEKRAIEKRKIILAEKEQKERDRADAMELARLEEEKIKLKKQNLKLEEERLRLEKEKLKEEKEAKLEKAKEEKEKYALEKRKIALAEKEQERRGLVAAGELARLEREKLKERRKERALERRKTALAEKQKRAEKHAEAREFAQFEKERRKKGRRRRKSRGELVEKLLEKQMLTLDDCIDVAMEAHLSLKVAERQLKLARFRLFEAKRNLGPTAIVKWEESTGRVDERLYTGEKIVVEGKQPIFYGGELVFSVRQAKVNLEIVESDYDRIKNDLVLQVKKAYYTVDKAKKALGIQEKMQDRTKALFDMVKAGYEAAVIPQVEFLRISSQYNQANFQVISAREDISVARLLLQQAMSVEEEIEIAGLKEPEIIRLDLDECFNLASLNRPEIKINQLSLEYFRYEKKIMQARAHWPRVDLLGSYGNAREDYAKGDIDAGKDPRGLGPEYYFGTKISLPIWGSTFGYSYTKEDWTPVVQTVKGTEAQTNAVTFSLFDKLEDISGVKEADIEYMRSLNEINKKKQEITLEVKETFFKYRKAILLMEVAKSKVEFQAKQVEILEIRRELGEAQYSDVVEEMIKLAEEEFSYIQAISDYYISIASLNKAIGIDGYFEI